MKVANRCWNGNELERIGIYYACLDLSHLRNTCHCCTLAVAQHCPLSTKCTGMFNFQQIFKLAFKIDGIWPQANKINTLQAHIHNAVLLAWGSLRLAPNIPLIKCK